MLLENIITIEGSGQEFEDFYQKIERYSLDENDMTFKMNTFIPLESLSEQEQKIEAREKWGPRLELRCLYYHLARNEDSSSRFIIEAQSLQLAPRPFLEKLSRMYPTLRMQIDYIATIMGGIGQSVYENGEEIIIKSSMVPYPGYYHQAQEIFGYNRQELEEMYQGGLR